MASIYDKASLVLIPSGSKTSKVYSQKPVNGDGDFTFSRSTAATRVNADGNIEKETQNLLLQSNDFDTTWIKTGSLTLTSGQSGYDGSSDAWKLDVSQVFDRVFQSTSTSGVHTFSVYAKKGSLEGVFLRASSSGAPRSFFNLNNGTLGNPAGNLIDAAIEDVGNGWYRCSITYSDSTTEVRIYPSTANNSFPTSGNIYIQDAQLEQGLVARDYIETTTTAVEGGITDNVPRLDYTDSSCPSLLLEPQRTNLVSQSEYFDVTPSVKDASTIEVNGTTSPSGLDDACLFTETTANDRHGFYQYITITAGALTASIFTKEIDRRYIHFQSDATGTGASSYVDLQDGSVVSEGSGWSLSTEDYGNGWYRIKATCTAGGGNKYFIWGVSQNGTTNSYAGSTSKDFTFYGFQLEAGSYATSYIPTYGSAVTRNAEAALKTGVADLINDGEGSLYMEVTPTNFEGDQRFGISDNIGTNRIVLRLYNPSNLQLSCVIGSSVEVSIANSGYSAGNTYKIAGAWKDNDAVIYVNGVQVATDTNCNITPSNPLTRISFDNGVGTAKWENPVSQTMYFPTRLSNEELATLTTI